MQQVKVQGDYFYPEMRLICNQLKLSHIEHDVESTWDLLTTQGQMDFASFNPAATSCNVVLVLDSQIVVADPACLVKMIAMISGGIIYP